MPGYSIDPAVRAIFFDAVGTLLLPAAPVAATYQAVARRHGADLDTVVIHKRLFDAFYKQEKIDRDAGWRTDEKREAARWRAIVHEALRECDRPDACLAELWHHYSLSSSWKLQDDTGAVLARLHGRGYVLGMASNFDARLTDIVLAFPALKPLAERCVVSSLVQWRKPSKPFFEKVVERAGVPAGQILHVGDDYRNDMQGAQQAGLRALLLGTADIPDANRVVHLTEIG